MANHFFCVVALAAAAVHVAQGSICNDLATNPATSSDEALCRTTGCEWNGRRCTEPAACKKQDRVIKYLGRDTGLWTVRKPMPIPEHSSLCFENPECTAIYKVKLSTKMTTGPPNCNDMGMLPPHGRDQTVCAQREQAIFAPVRNDLRDFRNHPYPDVAFKQNAARQNNEVTALREESTNCWNNNNCAFPLGFASDIMHKNKAVCVIVEGDGRDKVGTRWVEIMASAQKGSGGGSFCVRDWNPDGTIDTDQQDEACTKEGDLYECRESGNNMFGEHMMVKFFAQDNTDDAHIEFNWRIVASKLPEDAETKEEKDAEDWCQFRDSADYPLSLMDPFPGDFAGRPVFEVDDSGAQTHGSTLGVVAAAICAAVLHLA